MTQPIRSERAAEKHWPGAGSGQRILVVEDDPDISHLLEIHLCDQAYTVDVARNGIDARLFGDGQFSCQQSDSQRGLQWERQVFESG